MCRLLIAVLSPGRIPLGERIFPEVQGKLSTPRYVQNVHDFLKVILFEKVKDCFGGRKDLTLSDLIAHGRGRGNGSI